MSQNTTGEIAKSDMLTTPLDRVITSNGQGSTSRRRDDRVNDRVSDLDRAARVSAVGIASRYIDTPHVLRVEIDLRMSSATRANMAAARLLETAVEIASTDTVTIPDPDNKDDGIQAERVVQAGRVARFHHENAPID